MPAYGESMREAARSIAIINACKPYHGRDKFPPSSTPSDETRKKARENFGWSSKAE
jgi:hypothetical protein